MKGKLDYFGCKIRLESLIVCCMFLICLIHGMEQFKVADMSEQMQLKWSFVSQIHHTWFKEIVNSHFSNCSTHQQLNALYNCNTSVTEYKTFWEQFIHGVQQIKFRKTVEDEDHAWAQMMIQASEQWIAMNKTSQIVQIQEAYEDISNFPNNLMEFAQFYPQHQDQFDDMVKAINWKREQKVYLTKKEKDEQAMKKDQTLLFRKYFSRQCFDSADLMTECKMPLQRYSYYLKDLFFYYFQQPQKYSKFDPKQGTVTIEPMLDYKITKLWRDMRGIMRKHLDLGDLINLQQVEKMSPDILESVMESLIKRSSGKSKNQQQQQEQGQL